MTGDKRNSKRCRHLPRGMLLILVAALAILVGVRLSHRPPTAESVPHGVRIELSEVQDDDPAEAEIPAPLASSTPLPPARVEAILARLPAVQGVAPPNRPVAAPVGSPSRPAAAVTAQVFPSAAHPGPVQDERAARPAGSPVPVRPRPSPLAEPLKVVRHTPEGAVSEAKGLTIAFNQPMVELSTVGHVASGDIPARLSPEPKGEWKWLDVRTLTFVPASRRLPMATRYQVEVPRGVRSALGSALQTRVHWTFTTPPPRVLDADPSGDCADLKPLLTLCFDQDVDAREVAKRVRLVAGSTEFPISLRLSPWYRLVGDTVHLAPDAPLPPSTRLRLVVAAGMPSVEGPLMTSREQAHGFSTHGPFRLQDDRKQQKKRQALAPHETLELTFTNPIKEDSVSREQVTLVPPVTDLQACSSGATIRIDGSFVPGTSYVATIDGNVTDTFGQTLGKPLAIPFRTVAAPTQGSPYLSARGRILAVVDPVRSPRLDVTSYGVRDLKVSTYRVSPGDWRAFVAACKQGNEIEDEGESPSPSRSHKTAMRLLPLPGTACSTFVVPVEETVRGESTEFATTSIDLAPVFRQRTGHLVVCVEPATWSSSTPKPRILTWCQATHIRLHVAADATQAVALATSSTDGSPVEGVTVEFRTATETKSSAVTGRDGLARLPLPKEGIRERIVLWARKGTDLSFDPVDELRVRPPASTLLWHVFSERGVYRPGEVVHLKGWVRAGVARPGSAPQFLGSRLRQITYVLRDHAGKPVKKGSMRLGPLGSFDTTLTLPTHVKLGDARVEFEAHGRLQGCEKTSFTHELKVEEYRAPEFEVKASTISPGPFFPGDYADVSARASYLAGGPLAGATIKWHVAACNTRFVPAGWEGYHFEGGESERIPKDGWTLEGHTRTTGLHRLRLQFGRYVPRHPLRVTIESTVTDANRRSWSDTECLLMHPSSLLVGLRSGRFFAEAGEDLEIDGIVTDVDGHPVAGRSISLEIAREEGDGLRTHYVPIRLTRDTVDSKATPVRLPLPVVAAGLYRITARVTDERGRCHRSEITLYVAGGTRARSIRARDNDPEIELDKDEYEPGDEARLLVRSPIWPAEGLLTVRRGGLVHARAFHVAGSDSVVRIPVTEALVGGARVSIAVQGLADVESREARIPLRPVTRREMRSFSGSASMTVSTRLRRLKVDVTPEKRFVEPGTATSVKLAVTDASGHPAADADVALAVVDEAALALSGYRLDDPLPGFYPLRSDDYEPGSPGHFGEAGYYDVTRAPGAPAPPSYSGLVGPGIRDSSDVSLEARDPNTARFVAGIGSTSDVRPIVANMRGSSRRHGGIDGLRADLRQPAPGDPPLFAAVRRDSETGALRLRSNFNPVAVFKASARTDAQGHATVRFRLPDNLTRYRVMAVAAAGERCFGKGESTLTARLPLMARPSPPRFLNSGDRMEFPILLQNQTEEPLEVDIAVRAHNAHLSEPAREGAGGTASPTVSEERTFTSRAGRHVTVPAQGRVEVRFPAATAATGTAVFQVAAVSGGAADSAQVSIPVHVPATMETFASYGVLDGIALLQPLDVARDVLPGFGGLEVTTSSTQLQALTDALVYVQGYPYECNEQLSSKVLTVAALRDVLTAFDAPGLPSPAAMTAGVEQSISLMAKRQYPDGGFGYWEATEGHEDPFVTVHVAHALQMAREKGFAVPGKMLDRVRGKLREIDRHVPTWYGTSSRQTLAAYALYVRHRLGDPVAKEARGLLTTVGLENLSLEAVAWLLPAISHDKASGSLAREMIVSLSNNITETSNEAHCAASTDCWLLCSGSRADAVVVDALLTVQPHHDLVEKLVRGLLSRQTQGRWNTTQENTFVLLALDHYFERFEKKRPDFVARLWVGESFAGERAFRGRTKDKFSIHVPMARLLDPGAGGAPAASPPINPTGSSSPSNSTGGASPSSSTRGASPVSLTLGKQGQGRLYYRMALRSAPATFVVGPASHGFEVERRYESVDKKGDVKQDASGAWHIRAGAPVRIRIRILTRGERHHVALVDPLPAGLESVNPALAGSESIAQRPSATSHDDDWPGWAMRGWFDHQDLRDDRAQAFTLTLPEGTFEYAYIARATTLGIFIAPPAKAEEMYHPETFGRGPTDRVIVE